MYFADTSPASRNPYGTIPWENIIVNNIKLFIIFKLRHKISEIFILQKISLNCYLVPMQQLILLLTLNRQVSTLIEILRLLTMRAWVERTEVHLRTCRSKRSLRNNSWGMQTCLFKGGPPMEIHLCAINKSMLTKGSLFYSNRKKQTFFFFFLPGHSFKRKT